MHLISIQSFGFMERCAGDTNTCRAVVTQTEFFKQFVINLIIVEYDTKCRYICLKESIL